MDSLGRLAGRVAHDFSNMLSVISGYSPLINLRLDRNGLLIPDLKQIEYAAKRSRDITSQLLAFSRKQVLLRKKGWCLDRKRRFEKGRSIHFQAVQKTTAIQKGT